ncbi:hypothetical protein BJ322DRAFT_1078911 [Thelephora terrestris]|uniref:DUF6535 domain-containing protein n=1 Tax=Thelephora terrestris TaxID=56493 RepID=A0A9P6HAB2_9AGAM|nr:hypothetical protein BJ322DRAFT_1078911 [Thelephora terrestris]
MPKPSATWPGPSYVIVVVQCLLYASLAISLFTALVAMLGKQWLRRKSWDRQNKLQGMENWRFHVVMESLPIMLQLALLLFGCALSGYLWSLNRAVGSVVLAFTSCGVAFYAFITIAGSHLLRMSIPDTCVVIYQGGRLAFIPPHFPRHHSARQPIPPASHPIGRSFRLVKSMIRQAPALALGAMQELPVMDDINVFPLLSREDSKCVLWTMDTSADADVLSFAFRFAADIVWYPGIATSVCPIRLARTFLDCSPTENAHATSPVSSHPFLISTRASGTAWKPSTPSENRSAPWGGNNKDPDVAMAWWILTLTFHEEILVCPPLQKNASQAFCIWLSHMILQSVYWRQARAENRRYSIVWFGNRLDKFWRSGRFQMQFISTSFLPARSRLAFPLNISDLHVSNNSDLALRTALKKLNEWMTVAIYDLSYDEEHIRVVLRFLRLWNDSGFQDLATYCMAWIQATLDSERPELQQYRIARNALLVLDDYPGFSWFDEPIPLEEATHAKVALRYLVLYDRTRTLGQTDSAPCLAAAIIALQILRMECSDAKRPAPKIHLLDNSLVHTLTWASQKEPGNPLHFRLLAREIFTLIGGMWFDPWVDDIPEYDRAQFIDALGNVLDARDPTHGTPHLPTQTLLSTRIGAYDDATFAGRTGAFVDRSSNIFLIPILFGLCSSRSWQTSITKSTFSFVSDPHSSLMNGNWNATTSCRWLSSAYGYRPTLKSSRKVSGHGLERETIEMLEIPGDSGWAPLRGYFPIILDTYVEPDPDDTITSPFEAARLVFRCDEQLRARQSNGGSYRRPSLEPERPLHWKIHKVCMVKRLCQVLTREREIEGLDALDLLRTAPNDGELISSQSDGGFLQDTSQSA